MSLIKNLVVSQNGKLRSASPIPINSTEFADGVFYVEVPHQSEVSSFYFPRASEFIRWFLTSAVPRGHSHESYTATGWEEHCEEYFGPAWQKEVNALAYHAEGTVLFASGAVTITQRWRSENYFPELLAVSNEFDFAWEAATANLHSAHLFSLREAKALVDGSHEAPWISHHQSDEVREAVHFDLNSRSPMGGDALTKK